MMKLEPEIMKIKALLKSVVFAIVFIIANLFLVQNSFGQAGPVRLNGSGGAITEINVGGIFYEVHTYTATGSSTFTPPSGAANVEYLVVAGGGGGGSINLATYSGSGGGAGGMLTGSLASANYNITVGGGGTAGTPSTDGGSGANSSIGSLVIAIGGGGGGSFTGSGGDGITGGSGGGSRGSGATGGSGTAGQGNNGGSCSSGSAGSGGGGAGAAAVNVTSTGVATAGGIGLQSAINGTNLYYAGGGGGGGNSTTNDKPGGLGGGGAAGVAGTVNTGGGGGGKAYSGASGNGAAGGSGIVIIRYKAPTMLIATQPSTTVNAGTDFTQPVMIKISDGNGIAVPGIVVTAAIQSGTGGTLTNNTATTDASGNATFTNLQLSGPSGNVYTLNFKVSGSTNLVVSNTISVCSNPVSSITAHTNITCNGNHDGSITVTATGGTSPYTFSINNGTYAAGNTANTNTFTGLAPNTPYQIKVQDLNGCISK
jgi:hypothetical protein